MNGLLSMIGIQTELDYLMGDFAACFGNTPLAIPKGSIHSDKQKCQTNEQHEFNIKGVNAHTHAGINTQFSLHFVKTGIVDIAYGSFLARMFQLRQKADYNCAYEISENDILEIIGLSHDFIKTILNLVK